MSQKLWRTQALGVAGPAWPDRAKYLQTKAAVDASSRSAEVYATLVARLRALVSRRRQLRVVDVGAGALSCVQLTCDAIEAAGGVVSEYVAIDADADLLAIGHKAYPNVSTIAMDVFAYSADHPFDIVVANAFADLAAPDRVAALFDRLAAPDAILYLPITFAGHTSLEPPLDPEQDGKRFDAYHRHLIQVERQRFDIEQLNAHLAGRFRLLRQARSDWLLPFGHPFTNFIVDFVSNALAPAALRDGDRDALSWIRSLRSQAARPTMDRSLRAINFDLLLDRALCRHA